MSVQIVHNENLSSGSYHEKFKAFVPVLQYFLEAFEGEVEIGITDRHEFIITQKDLRLPLNIKIGTKIQEKGPVAEVLRTGKMIVTDIPKEMYGLACKVYAVPIKDENNQVIGCLVIGRSLEKSYELATIIENLTLTLDQISSSISNISNEVQQIVDMNSLIASNVKKADDESKDTDGILNFIQGIASQTNMLGLNAAIEASRAGEAGKGFKVVATEIRKLSTSTSESIKKVDNVLKSVSASIKEINEKIIDSNKVFESQASALMQIASSIEELNSTAHMLEKLSKKI